MKADGALPDPFYGKREEAEKFLREVQGYFRSNRQVAGYNSPIRKVAITLTLLKGQDVSAWADRMGDWIDTLHPVDDDIDDVWTTFLAEFRDQYADSQRQQRARQELETLRMTGTEIDKYIAKFEDLVTLSGYTVGNEETMNFFIAGLPDNILIDISKPTFPQDYDELRRRAIQLTKARQLVDVIRARRGTGRPPPRVYQTNYQPMNQYRRPQPFPGYQRTQPRNPQPPSGGYNSTNAPRWMANTPVPMDTSARSRAPYNRRGQRGYRANQIREEESPYEEEEQVQVAQTQERRPPKGPCFKCGNMGHFARDCRGKARVNYMDAEDTSHITMPPMTPVKDMSKLAAQINRLSLEDYDALIEEIPKDFQQA
jgi:hypothetical protein